ncbi:hypothetical protein ANANG_G00127260 [Anguilla anguilla]|uniref:Uncharacterized protein n=1 Tax=Anguilla anguilla TaxID=7936 RepID=A0A9D3MEM6_ANGAN|nr:hypothetical protein ANANG_G00127260 [Anguilla anguilla]
MDRKHLRSIKIHSATPGQDDLGKSALMLRPKSAKGRRRNSAQAPNHEEWLENIPNHQACVVEPPFIQPVLTSGSSSGQSHGFKLQPSTSPESLPPSGWQYMQQVRDNKQPKLCFPSPPSPSLIPPTPSTLNRYRVLPSIRQRKEENPPKKPLEP